MPIVDMHHVVLLVTDLDRSVDFYCGKLDFELVARNDDRGGEFLDTVCQAEGVRINIALVRGGGEIIELIQVLRPDGFPTDVDTRPFGMARIGFEVTDIEGTVADLRRRGVEPMSEIATVTSGHYSGGRAVFFRDPDGIILELQEPVVPGRVT